MSVGMNKVLAVFGTRPEAIKMAPVLNALQSRDDRFETRVCVTAQHREMLDQVLDLFDIVPHYDLNVMTQDQSPTEVVSRILHEIGGVLDAWRPDLVLVHGDTATTLAASLGAYFHKIPVGHVEAGLRTGNIYAPWPEEVNRRVCGIVTRWHFAPTERARENLLKEGVPDDAIEVTGNTVIDALKHVVALIEQDRDVRKRLESRFAFLDSERRLVLVTGHRRENFGAGFERVCASLKDLATQFDDVEIVYPVHLNPYVRDVVTRTLLGVDRVHLIDPLDYLPFVYLMNRSFLIVTDSGGIQEEAPSLGKPIIVTRERTERPEAVEAGTVKLVGTDRQKIVQEAVTLLNDPQAYAVMAQSLSPYGDGKAASRIVGHLMTHLGMERES